MSAYLRDGTPRYTIEIDGSADVIEWGDLSDNAISLLPAEPALPGGVVRVGAQYALARAAIEELIRREGAISPTQFSARLQDVRDAFRARIEAHDPVRAHPATGFRASEKLRPATVLAHLDAAITTAADTWLTREVSGPSSRKS